jgi:hypothetical protein
VSEHCSAASRAAHEPLAGTAPIALGWLLLEQPGSWGRDALTGSGLDPAVGAGLAAATNDLPVRVQTIRRPTLVPAAPPVRRTVVLAHTGPSPWAESLTVASADEVLDLDPAVCTASEPPGLGTPVAAPLLLVCTHGKRDRCCATLGRPIAAALGALHHDRVWEVSHVGGHRFAGNLVVLPHGLVYGGLGVSEAVRVTDLLLADRIDAGHLRGRSGLGRPAQAAEVFVRRELGLDHLDAVRVESVASDAGRHRVEVTVLDDLVTSSGGTAPDGGAAPDGDTAGTAAGGWVVEVVREPLGTAFTTSCDAEEPEDPHAFRLAALSRRSSAAGDQRGAGELGHERG